MIARETHMDKYEKLIYWIIFNVFISLLPLLFNYLFLSIQDSFSGLNDLFYRGELFIISAVIAADAVGEFMIGTIRNKYARLITGGSCVILLTMSSLLFAATSVNIDQINHSRVTGISVTVIIATIISSGASKFLSVST